MIRISKKVYNSSLNDIFNKQRAKIFPSANTLRIFQFRDWGRIIVVELITDLNAPMRKKRKNIVSITLDGLNTKGRNKRTRTLVLKAKRRTRIVVYNYPIPNARE